MKYSFKSQGNYFVITETTSNKELLRKSKADIYFRYENERVSFYDISTDVILPKNTGFAIADIVDKNNNAFTNIDELLLFISYYTGTPNKTIDFELELAEGNIPGYYAVNKFGRATDVDSIATDIFDRANTTDNQKTHILPTQARTHTIKSTSANDTLLGTGAKTLKIYGLVDWDSKEVSEIIEMNGVTTISTQNQYVIIHRIKVLTKGSLNVSAGVITATADVDLTVTAQVNIGEGQTQMAIYGIPSTQTAFVKKYYMSAIKGSTSLALECTLLVNPEPQNELTNFLTKNTNGIVTEGTSFLPREFSPPMKVDGPAIIKLQGNSSVANTDVSGGFDLILKDI